VPGSARKAKVGVALNNSAGFGGCNASVIFGRWEI
jgi:3-oxoacyl-(acyl-carrier-protein) synthase